MSPVVVPFAGLEPRMPGSLLVPIAMHRADKCTGKIDVGVCAGRDGDGQAPATGACGPSDDIEAKGVTA